MRDETLFIHTYIDQTTIHPFALILLIILGVFVFYVSRRSVIIPLLVLSCFVSPAQRIVVFGLDFNLIRILILLGWLRVVIKKENSQFQMKQIDWILLFWSISSFATYVMLRGSFSAFVHKLGYSIDSIGMYFLFRCLIRDFEDAKNLASSLLYLSLPVAFFLMLEKNTGHNIFSVFGGVPEFTDIRNGKLRAQGAFAHSILAGCFWVTQLPLFIAMLWQGARKWLVVCALIASILIVYACASSTPVAGLGAVLVGFLFWSMRKKMKYVVYSGLITLITLHVGMKAPVWHLVSRIDFVGGSTGYHRYLLIDQAIQRFSEWWLFGALSTAHWGWFLFDTANMYVNEAVRGGISTLVLFVLVIVVAFRDVGRIIDNTSLSSLQIFGWALGVSLFTHCIVFIAVSYFGQIIVVWFMLLACIGSLSPSSKIPDNVVVTSRTESQVPAVY